MVNRANMAKSSSESPLFTIHYSLFTDRRSGIHLRDDELIKRDERDLSHFGYAQELFRTMGGFSNFAISFSIISILTGAVTLYGDGLAKGDRKSTRLNSSHSQISYAVFCLKKKKNNTQSTSPQTTLSSFAVTCSRPHSLCTS